MGDDRDSRRHAGRDDRHRPLVRETSIVGLRRRGITAGCVRDIRRRAIVAPRGCDRGGDRRNPRRACTDPTCSFPATGPTDTPRRARRARMPSSSTSKMRSRRRTRCGARDVARRMARARAPGDGARQRAGQRMVRRRSCARARAAPSAPSCCRRPSAPRTFAQVAAACGPRPVLPLDRNGARIVERAGGRACAERASAAVRVARSSRRISARPTTICCMRAPNWCSCHASRASMRRSTA